MNGLQSQIDTIKRDHRTQIESNTKQIQTIAGNFEQLQAKLNEHGEKINSISPGTDRSG